MSPTHLGKYRILQLLAAGGMGEVFLARHEGPAGFAKPAVVKRILAHLAREPGFVEMFLDEARLAAVLSHPNVVQIFELGEADGTWFIAMEYLHGRTMRALQKEAAKKREHVRPVQAARILSQALTGLHYAHTAAGENGEPLNIVHRDMSPDNVMVGFNGVVKVLDFGIAKAATALTTTRTGQVKGKFAYMAPEQLLAEKVDGRADVYSVGVMLYELLSGSRPFTAPSEAALINLILNTPFTPLAQKAPNVPAELSALVTKALEKDRAARWSTAEEFATALEKFVHSTGEPGTNAGTAAYMKEIFEAAALDNPSMVTPSALSYVSAQALPEVEVSLNETRTSTPSKPKKKPKTALFVATGVALLAAVGFAGITIGRHPGTPPADSVKAIAPPVEPPAVAAVPAQVIAAVPVAAAVPVPVEAVDAGAAPVVAVEAKKTGVGKGRLELRVNPWGEIFEGSKSLGITPMPPIELPAGVHKLIVKNSELKVSRAVTVKVPRNGTATLRIDLLD
jgi:eukaryotic-like serine/threonine-protein kinase